MTNINLELVDQILEQIRLKPEHWNQNVFYDGESATEPDSLLTCGTAFCFGGWALVLSDKLVWRCDEDGWFITLDENNKDHVYEPLAPSELAAKVLGFNETLADRIFYNYTRDPVEFARHVRDSILVYGDLTEAEKDVWYSR